MSLVAAIDQGTTSSRCLLFDRELRPVALARREHRQIHPAAGWVEHDPLELWRNTQQVIGEALRQIDGAEVSAIGITNQRETLVFWDRRTGTPFGNALVWQDTRTQGLCDEYAARLGQAWFRQRTGLPVAAYFSAPKIRWALDNWPDLAAAVTAGRAACGTVESWLVWNLTGGLHVTDVANASRTLLMNLTTLAWDDELLELFGIPSGLLPRIVPNSCPGGYGSTQREGPFGREIPVCGMAGDQQAALIGQRCFSPGDAKNTYGTGCFLLVNAGAVPPQTEHGLLATLAYQIGDEVAYALEGSVAVAGALVQWLRDNLGIIEQSAQIEALAGSVPDSGGVCLVPAFSGLFAPHWDASARGLLVGLSHESGRPHIARAALEAVAFQVAEVVRAAEQDLGFTLPELRVDGGMVVNELLMQFQSDLLDKPVVRSSNIESTALGAALLAGIAQGVWSDLTELRENREIERRWTPRMEPPERASRFAAWRRAVARSRGWLEGGGA